jgi:hypothetical protein
MSGVELVALAWLLTEAAVCVTITRRRPEPAPADDVTAVAP